jgi:hypothetical protein
MRGFFNLTAVFLRALGFVGALSPCLNGTPTPFRSTQSLHRRSRWVSASVRGAFIALQDSLLQRTSSILQLFCNEPLLLAYLTVM